MHPARAPLAIVLALLAAACGESAPRYTLQQVMYQVDYLDKAILAALEQPEGAVAGKQKTSELVYWWQEAPFEQHLGSVRFRGDRASFEAKRGQLASVLNDLEAAFGAGDLALARAVHARLRATCDACHAEFRPELLPGGGAGPPAGSAPPPRPATGAAR
jgi:hypothetical protein